MPRAAATLLALAVLAVAPRAGAKPLCEGRYADTLSVMRAAARAREARPAAEYTYCLRATAVYEHVAYARGGKLRREYHTKVRHGTGFAYRKSGAAWLLATNHHVISFPEVTGDGADVEGVPPGSRRIREDVRIVANEAEPDLPEQIVLSPVVEDEAFDVAVLSSTRPLQVIPYRLGHSRDVQVGNAVLVRGFPLGAFPAANSGKVIGVGQRDAERGWDHEDFAVDALLNLGSSGSPVLAVSCTTGEPEVVGIYHAGYRGAQGLNVVIAVDQLRPLLDDLRAPARAVAADEPAADVTAARAALLGGPVVIPFAGRAVRVEREGDAVRFAILDEAFPLSARVELAVVDRGGDVGADGRGAEIRAALWEQLALVLSYRAAEDRREGGRAPSVKGRIAARLRDREDDQAELLAALRAGADGLPRAPAGELSPSAQSPAQGESRARAGGLEVIVGAR